ncbi:uncharacterized protein LOC113666280 isoform X2 [Pocillopora damicornis]|uniref:uncharacterized protein LOC113666280 isoform X2 n=1 Tax=Pocillopora damicornis TaxID=46731 RepID=UPI000F54FA8D|nr:uncharacterized protein LOC113666280 isoform X2 [Pocillopora damicornis]
MDILKTLILLFLVSGTIQTTVFGRKKGCSCYRLPNTTTIGIDVRRRLYEADMGRCVETCNATDSDTIKATPEMSSGSSSCNPTEVTSRSYPLIGGSKYKTAIAKCGYQNTSSGCSRQALFKTFFDGTSYSIRHDIGVCHGSCGSSGHACKAIDSLMMAIKGPNGKGELTHRVIKKCGCVNPICHRVAFREVFKRKSGNTWIQEEKDVGTCVGTGCPRSCVRCFFGNKYCTQHCLVFRERACIATNYTTEHVHTGDHKEKEMHIITECGCK